MKLAARITPAGWNRRPAAGLVRKSLAWRQNVPDAPPAEWTSLPLTITREPDAEVVIYFSVSPDLEAALGASAQR